MVLVYYLNIPALLAAFPRQVLQRWRVSWTISVRVSSRPLSCNISSNKAFRDRVAVLSRRFRCFFYLLSLGIDNEREISARESRREARHRGRRDWKVTGRGTSSKDRLFEERNRKHTLYKKKKK